jgi:hypothetical protein
MGNGGLEPSAPSPPAVPACRSTHVRSCAMSGPRAWAARRSSWCGMMKGRGGVDLTSRLSLRLLWLPANKTDGHRTRAASLPWPMLGQGDDGGVSELACMALPSCVSKTPRARKSWAGGPSSSRSGTATSAASCIALPSSLGRISLYSAPTTPSSLSTHHAHSHGVSCRSRRTSDHS